MKKLVATAPRVAALVEYEDRAILANEVKIDLISEVDILGNEITLRPWQVMWIK